MTVLLLSLAGCAKDNDEKDQKPAETDRGYETENHEEAKKEEVEDTKEESIETDDKVGKVQVKDIEDDDSDDDIETYYSHDKAVALRLNYTDMTAAIIDGDDILPVEISMAPYGPYIEKCDVNDDGKDDYIIAECEGNGTGFCIYGLCILKNNGGDYDFYRYDGRYFSEILSERISYSFDNDTKEVTFTIDNEEPLTYKKVLDTNEELSDVIWSDIIRISFRDTTPYIMAPSGYIYKDIPMPDYEQAMDITVPIEIHSDLSVTLGHISPVDIVYKLDDDSQIKGIER